MKPDRHFEEVNRHYGCNNLSERILSALQSAGKDTENLSLDDLATFEQFHIGGREETLNLASLAGITSNMRLLDVGCGIGGPARTLATEFGCNVTGLDLTEEYIDAAEMLTHRVGITQRLTFRNGSALSIPFADSSFDMVWTQHVGMNIEDKLRWFTDMARVLREGGKLAFHEVFSGSGKPLDYPVFWAAEESMSFLLTVAQTDRLLLERGFVRIISNDVTVRSVTFFKNMVSAFNSDSPPPLGLGVIVPADVPKKAENILRGLTDGRLVVIQAVYEIRRQQ
ncbi:MAG: class I SAM-dependent methyltransferase [Candidatus Zixiibacteriota bacterium]